jgi:Flp pilus assembly protein CpaB
MSMNSQKTMIIVLAAAVVIGGVAYLGVDFPTGNDQASGTIVPAERYRGEQIDSKDVELGDESVSQLMQTDLFQQIVSDAAFADAMRGDAFRSLMASEAFRNAMASDSFRNAMSSEALRNAMANDSFRNAMANDSFRNAMATDASQRNGRRLIPQCNVFRSYAKRDGRRLIPQCDGQ